MNTKNFLITIIVILSTITFLGCIGVDGDFREVKSLVMKSTNDKFSKSVEFSVGPLGLSFARFCVSFDDDNRDAEVILSNISEVQVGIYKKYNSNTIHYRYSFFHEIDDKLKEESWHNVVRHIDGDELTGIYFKYEDDLINKMYVINIKNNKLTLIRIKGNLEDIITYAIKDKGFDRVSFR
jgi:hypothetical protein